VEEAVAGGPFEPSLDSVLDEALAPVDRDVFRRQVRYDALIQSRTSVSNGTAGQGAAPAADRK